MRTIEGRVKEGKDTVDWGEPERC